MELRIVSKIREIEREAWDALVPFGSSPFVEWTWLDTLEEAECVGPKAGWYPRHFALYDGNELIGAAPAYVKTNSEGEFVYDWAWADLAARMGLDYYPKLVFAVPFTPATGNRVLVKNGVPRGAIVNAFADAAKEFCTQAQLAGAHTLFHHEDENAEWVASRWMRRVGIQYHWHNRGYSTWEDFLASLTSKRRNQLKRETAQPAKDGVEIITLAPSDLTPQVASTMHRLYLTTVDKFVYGRRYLTAEFFQLIAKRFAHRLAWVVAKKGDEIVAGAFNAKKDNALYGRYWGTFVDLPFLHFNVCYYHGVKEAIAEKLERFEPGAGGEHKRVRGFDPTLTFSAHHIEHPRLNRLLANFVVQEEAAIRAHIAGEGEEPI